MSSISLDKSIYEELKSSTASVKQHLSQADSSGVITANVLSSTPSLSNILSQNIGVGSADLLSSGNHSPLDFSGAHGQPNASAAQAQILNFSNVEPHSSLAGSSSTSDSTQLHSATAKEQHQLSMAALNFNLSSPPCLFLYIVDPFEYNLYNSLIKLSDMQPNEMDLDEGVDETATETKPLSEQELKRLVKIGMFKVIFFIKQMKINKAVLKLFLTLKNTPTYHIK